ncbi:MAG TPA: hydrolase [Verrucomicrobiae bacterium]|jgi:nicotinamidase-related amidase
MNHTIIDKSKTALVVIDLQKGIVGRPAMPHTAEMVVKNSAALAAAARRAGMPVFLVHVAFSPDNKDVLNPQIDQPTPIPVRPADWTDIVPAMEQQPDDHLITKHQWGAFHGTELELQLRRRGITTIILCGISTNIGVESTARFAFEYGFQQIFVEDAMSAFSTEEHAMTVTKIFPRIGRVRATAEVLAGLSAA